MGVGRLLGAGDLVAAEAEDEEGEEEGEDELGAVGEVVAVFTGLGDRETRRRGVGEMDARREVEEGQGIRGQVQGG